MFNAQLLGNGRCHGNCMMGCDHPSFIPIGPLTGELWHFQYFPTWRPSAILNYIFFYISPRDCHCGPNVPLSTKFHKNWFTRSTSRRPQMLNVHRAVARQRPLPWQPHHGFPCSLPYMGVSYDQKRVCVSQQTYFLKQALLSQRSRAILRVCQ